MKGVVFNLLEDVVTQGHGADAWDAILDAAGADGAYTSLGDYADEELERILASAAGALGLPADDVLRVFGREAAPRFLARYPFHDGHASAAAFLATLDDVVQPQVAQIFRGSSPPRLDPELDGRQLVLRTASTRGLCAVLEGMVEGVAGLFGEVATIEQASCVRRGDACCTLVCSFAEVREP
ncbi:MAG: heme NO-binding domain-containing protein [Thermoleophilia bacterium]